jgi:serine protease Do
MSALSNASRKSILGLVTTVFLGSAMVIGANTLPAPQLAFAGTASTLTAAIDPTKGFSPLVEQVMPAVVSVEVKYDETAAMADGSMEGGGNSMPNLEQLPPQLRDLFKQFQDQQGQAPGMAPDKKMPHKFGTAMGSGFVISADGYVVTNNHVVKDASEVKLHFQNGDDFDAKVIGTDAKTDIALLKIKSDKSFPFVNLAHTDAKVGDWVMAVGNPFGLGGTVTAGIISARGRDIGSGPYDDFLQIDASINKGNSGGPTFNLVGEVVGVNTAIFSPSGGSVGIGFAIPANIVSDVVDSLKSNGSVTRGWLGVQIQPVTQDLAESLGLQKPEGAIVSDLTEDSPAQKAGLKQGDTILKVDGKIIADAKDLSRLIAHVKPSASVAMDLVRDGKLQTITVKIGTMPGETPKMASTGTDQKGLDLSDLGIKVAPAEDGAGVRITDLDPNSKAAERGLAAGDIIMEVGGKPVTNPEDVSAALKLSKGKQVLMLVRRGDGQRFLTLPRDHNADQG